MHKQPLKDSLDDQVIVFTGGHPRRRQWVHSVWGKRLLCRSPGNGGHARQRYRIYPRARERIPRHAGLWDPPEIPSATTTPFVAKEILRGQWACRLPGSTDLHAGGTLDSPLDPSEYSLDVNVINGQFKSILYLGRSAVRRTYILFSWMTRTCEGHSRRHLPRNLSLKRVLKNSIAHRRMDTSCTRNLWKFSGR